MHQDPIKADLIEDVDGNIELAEGENVRMNDAEDSKEAKRVLRKVDWRLIPLLTLLYIMCFIDRSNSEFEKSFPSVPWRASTNQSL